MNAFMKHLLESLNVDSSHVTIIEDNASSELHLRNYSTPYSGLSMVTMSGNRNPKSNASAQSRWSVIPEHSHEKIELSELRRWNPSPFTTPQHNPPSTSQSEGLSKRNPDIGIHEKQRQSRSKSFPMQSSNRVRMFHSSFPSAHLTRLRISNSRDGEDENDNNMPESLDEIESEHSIDVLEDLLRDRTTRSNEKVLPSSYSYNKRIGFGSSADMTDSTFDMEDSFLSTSEHSRYSPKRHTKFLNYNNQAPRPPQRKISKEKLSSLNNYLDSKPSADLLFVDDESKIKNKNNDSFDDTVESTVQKRWRRGQYRLRKTNHPLFTRVVAKKSQSVSENKAAKTNDSTAQREKNELTSMRSPSLPRNSNPASRRKRTNKKHDVARQIRLQRLRVALGSMAPSPLGKSGRFELSDDDNSDVDNSFIQDRNEKYSKSR